MVVEVAPVTTAFGVANAPSPGVNPEVRDM